MKSFWRSIYDQLLLIVVAAFFLGGFFWSCANIGATPQGGPKDTIPPKVVRMTPEFNSTNFWPGRINIEFDEYVQLKDLQKNFYSSPSMNVRPTTDIRGRGIVINVEADLDSNTTYVLNYGSSVVDNNEGNPLIGLRYTFSTGDEIDSLFMTGLVQDAMTSDTVPEAFIFFYDAATDTASYDSLIFDARNALAVSRTAPNGIFIHSNLKPMDYRVYALLDNNGNQMYDPGVDDVAFMDSIYNPAEMPAFYMWYDTVLMYEVAEPQIFMRTFREEPNVRYNLRSSVREGPQKIILSFSSRFPIIEEFNIRGINDSNIIVEYAKETRDSIFYWINMDREEIADTLYADLRYIRHDSIGQLYSHEQELRLVYNRPFVSAREQRQLERAQQEPTPRQLRRAEKKAKRQARRAAKRELRLMKKGLYVPPPIQITDTVPVIDSLMVNDTIPLTEVGDSIKEPSQMKIILAGGNVVPGEIVKMSFDIPVIRFDSASVTMKHIDPIRNTEEDMSVWFVQDTLRIREYSLLVDWKNGDRYELMIPGGAIETIDGEENDTLTRTFTVAEMEKYGNLIFELTNANPEYEYIIRIYDSSGKTLRREIPHLKEGVHTINYVDPGAVVVRIVEDRNRNGKWDTGNIINRLQPEKVELLVDATTGEKEIPVRINRDFEITLDLENIFRPRVHFDRLIEQTEEIVEEIIQENNEEQEELLEDIWEYNMEDHFDSTVPLKIDQ